MQKKESKSLTKEKMEANICIFMGMMIVFVTFVWSRPDPLPDELFIIIGVLGIIPVLLLLFMKHEKKDDSEMIYLWNTAFYEAVPISIILLIGLWIIICMSKLFGDPITIDSCHIVPYFIGAIYMLTGDIAKAYMIHEEHQ